MEGNILVAVLSIFAVFIHLNIAVRISEKKCADYSTIAPSAEPQTHAHIVRIHRKTENGTTLELGTLISESFVLSTATAIYHLIVIRSYVKFSNGDEYNVVEKYIHPLFNSTSYRHNNLGLLRIESEIILDSSHRPACLWTKNYFETAYAEVYNFKDNILNSLSHRFPTGQNCTFARKNSNLFCVVQSNTEDQEWKVWNVFMQRGITPNWQASRGSPIQGYRPKQYLPDNYFIYGIVSAFKSDNHTIIRIGNKINYYIDWIESIVWPETNNFPKSITTTTCGHIIINFKPLISFSGPTFRGEFPWHAAVYQSQGYGERKYLCGGSLLNENTVLTAAHCLYDERGMVSPHLLIVLLGAYDLTTSNLDSRESYVDRAKPHEHFNRYHLENDIAILKLKTFIEFSNFIKPICITNDSTIFNSSVGVITGWGRNEHDIAENILTKASLPILTNTDCRDINRDIFPALLNDNNFCAGYGNGTGVCSGDSGGGLIFQYNGRSFIRGIVSFGLSVEGKCDSTQPAIFTDAVKFYNWITDKL